MDTYGFLYFRQRLDTEERYRTFKGQTLDDAARKMAGFLVRLRGAFAAWEDPEVDYEADVNPDSRTQRKQEDLYLLGEQHPIYEFLA